MRDSDRHGGRVLLQTGTIAGRYRIGTLLGTGGMAAVYRAVDTASGVEVAIKVLDPKLATQDGPRKRFAGEARTMIGLDHPGVVRVLDVGETSESSWLVMELLPGGSLADRLKMDGPFPPSRAAEILLDVLAALDLAHARGVVHRDVKPDNLLLDAAGHVKLTDFGIARAEDRTQSLTRTGSVLGTWAYMAPEQRADAKSVDGRADLFACGATLYALITGRPPMDLTTPEVRENLTRDGIPDGLAGVIRRATRYRAEDRYRSAHEMAEHLREMARSLEGLVARPPDPRHVDDGETYDNDPFEAGTGDSLDRELPAKAEAPPRGPWLAVGLGAAILAILALLVTVSLWSRGDGEPAPVPKGVHLDSRPPGVVMVDGVFKGATPWSVEALAPGEHELELRLRDGRTHKLELRGGEDHASCWDFEAAAPCR